MCDDDLTMIGLRSVKRAHEGISTHLRLGLNHSSEVLANRGL